MSKLPSIFPPGFPCANVFPAKMYYAYTFREIPVRHGVDSFTNVHTSTIYVYVEVVVHCMAGLLSYLLGCLVTTTYMQPNIP